MSHDVSEAAGEKDPAGAFRELMGHLAAGVTIVTSALDGVPVGMTATAVCSVSAAPPMLLVSLTTNTRTAAGVERSKSFTVHLLNYSGRNHAEKFARPGDHFAEVAYRNHAATGVPVLEDVLGYFVCAVERAVTVADHTIFFGRVLECELVATRRHPLIYFARGYREIAASPSAQAKSFEPWREHDAGLPGWGLPI
jgi:flavin reductase (DIM6/NTAB) family NADH-FMN oxidoreductase RutF